MTSYIRFPSPIGRISITGDGDAVTALSIDVPAWSAHSSGAPHADSHPRSHTVVGRAALQVLEYLEGDRVGFDVSVRLTGTAFQHAVWETLAAQPFGTATSYGDIAFAIGAPHAGRAVGMAVAANPMPLLIPCHRVLGARRDPVGYDHGKGLDTKEWLLSHERIAFSVTKQRARELATAQ